MIRRGRAVPTGSPSLTRGDRRRRARRRAIVLTLAAMAALVAGLAWSGSGFAAEPPTPHDLATAEGSPPSQVHEFMERNPKLANPENSPLLHKLILTYSSPLALPIHAVAAQAELQTILSWNSRPEVVSITLVPSGPGGRTPDLEIVMRAPDGRQYTMYVETKALTGESLGRRTSGHRGIAANYVPSAEAIAKTARLGLGDKSQLNAAYERNADARPGTLSVPVALGNSSDAALSEVAANIEKAMDKLAKALTGAKYVDAVEFQVVDLIAGPLHRFVLAPNGQYVRDPRTREQIEGRPRTAAPADAARDAVGQAATTTAPASATAGGSAFVPAGVADATETGPAADQLAGIDFTGLELRYLSDVSTETTKAAGFAFKGRPAGGRTGASQSSAQRASDAFFVWLALPTSAMWVNLNPSEPDRIIDPRFGRTNAGRVLLEADLRMKKTAARLTNPNTRLGARFWRQLEAVSGGQEPCFASRMWIVPARATVRETADELYIIKAPLTVKTESDRLGQLGSGCLANPHASEAVFRRLILPRVQRAVRRDPGFAALRSVYMSRVAAEWYRKRDKREGSAFGDIIDSGDISRWAPKRSWTPRRTFRRYVRSYKRGEYKVTRRSREGNYIVTRTYFDGGVDFSTVPRQNVSAQELQTLRPGLPGTIAKALTRPTADPQSGDVWLAGASFDRAAAVKDPAFNSSLEEAGSPLLMIVLLGLAVIVAVLIAGGWLVLRALRPARGPTPPAPG